MKMKFLSLQEKLNISIKIGLPAFQAIAHDIISNAIDCSVAEKWTFWTKIILTSEQQILEGVVPIAKAQTVNDN